MTASRSRRPQAGVWARRLASNSWLLRAVRMPARRYGPYNMRAPPGGRTRPAPASRPSVAAQGAMWVMLQDRTMSKAPVTGQSGWAASRAMAARTLGWAVHQASMLAQRSGSGSEGWKSRPGRAAAK